MSKLVKRWEQKDDVGSHAIGFTYVSDMSDLPVPVFYESWAGRGGGFDVQGDVVFVRADGRRVRLRFDRARSDRQVVQILDKFFESGGIVKGNFNSVPARSILETRAASISREILAARELVSRAIAADEIKITLSTVKSILKKMNLEDKADISGREVEFWPENFANSEDPADWHDGDKLAERAAKAFAKALGGASIVSNGNYHRVRWKGESLDMGDWNDKGSRWHY
jgi:hypothetical protein